MKKKWRKPELQVLIRGKIEESVLCHCKHNHDGSTWPSGSGCTHSASGCFTNNPS
ncbi:MAG: hypothetical protein GF421_11770 [Candidatus Aminicenantes bacterium]|nr:hypothetical protein [Candidatus Aminicenantes bacterium]